MLTRIGSALGYTGWVVANFFVRWREKGPVFARVFLQVRLINFWIHRLNKLCRRFPSLVRVECPCCGWTGRDFFWDDAVVPPLPSVFCPQCYSHERHRMLYTYIHRHDPGILTMPGRLLHFAPEEDVRRMFAGNPRLKYLSSEYEMKTAKRRCLAGTCVLGDIQRLGVADGSVDIVFCLHVLEHVRQDTQGLSEICRVLKPGGIAYIMVPLDMSLPHTVEWEEPRPEIHYHVWAYSPRDFKQRLRGLDFKEIKPDTFLTSEECTRFRIPPKEIIYRGAKPSPVMASSSRYAESLAHG